MVAAAARTIDVRILELQRRRLRSYVQMNPWKGLPWILGKDTMNSFREELVCLGGSVRGLAYLLGKITT